MRKIKVECRVPSWNFCNKDGFTSDNFMSKETCNFCKKTRTGYSCMLYDRPLRTDGTIIYKVPACIEATAKGVSVEEPPIRVDPKLIVEETISLYIKTVKDLLKQGYPRNIAETVATKYVKDGGPR